MIKLYESPPPENGKTKVILLLSLMVVMLNHEYGMVILAMVISASSLISKGELNLYLYRVLFDPDTTLLLFRIKLSVIIHYVDNLYLIF